MLGFGLETLNNEMTLTKEEASNLLDVQIDSFLYQELTEELRVYAEQSSCLEVLFSIRLYLGRELFYKSNVFSYLNNCVRFQKAVEVFFAFLKTELTKVTYKLEKKIYSPAWASLREKEILFLTNRGLQNG